MPHPPTNLPPASLAFAALRQGELTAIPPSHRATPDEAIAAIEAALVLPTAMVPQPCQQQQAHGGAFSSPDLVIEAALRNDARLGRPPRYSTASITPIQFVADQSKLDERIGQMHAAVRELTDRILDQADIIERLARRNLRGLDLRAIDDVRTHLTNAQGQLATADALLLDADDDLCLLDIDDMGTAMREAFRRLTATDLSARTDFEEHGLTAGDLLGRRTA